MSSCRIGVLAAWLLVVAQPGRAQDAAPLVLTGTQATYSLTVALAAGTPIQVQNVPADGRQLALLKDYIERRADALAPTFAAATAVVWALAVIAAWHPARYAGRVDPLAALKTE